ncbi:hypothetical protein [Microbacterium testaceum]|uniref:Uncharacterized protein n=1 Tax=Microbacterium testaceum TaxID=2033 RepID=A0A147FAL3_MICTE|nr:hypothetical protein [Microbacterium testaceum]KTS13529.1 hypothetical protein RSA3_04220 [Microbacterium testaceum]
MSGPPCRQPVPTDLLRRADAAAVMPQSRGDGRRRRRIDGGVEPDVLNMREATAALLFGLVTPRDVIALAADHLATGDDGASLAALAALYADATSADVFDLSSAALIERGERPLDRDGEEVALLALRVACRRFLAGDWKLRSFSSWVHDRIGHTGPDAAQPLVDFDDELDARNTRDDREYDTRAVGLAAAFLAEAGGSADDAP